MPDPTLTVDDMRSYGYLDGDMLPLSKDRAVELLEHDITVYMLHPDNAEEMVFEAEDIIKHDGMFGITRPDWDAVKGHIPPRDVEQRFLNSPTDSMAIYQLRRDAPVELRFANLGSLAAPPDPANYEAIYTREVYPDDDTGRILENFYYIFNDERPGDFVGHSLSVSDIVALKQDGKVSYHYCDSMGFQELPAFQKPENYLKAAEMSMEDDYGMIDGIINNGPKQPTVADLEAQVKAGMSISLMDLAEAAHRERDVNESPPCWSSSKANRPKNVHTKQRPKRARKRSFDMNITFEERQLMSLYNTGTRTGLIAALEEMRGYLAADETELRELTDSAIAKLRRMSDAEYDALDLFPDFEKEDMDAE